MRILIVDDDYQSRLVLERLLHKFGECHVEESGKKAVAVFVQGLFENRPFDLVCMDIMMPEMDGQLALKIMRTVEEKWGVLPGEEAKIMMVSALDDVKEVSKAFFQGCATDYIVKPITADVLLKKVEKLLDKTCT